MIDIIKERLHAYAAGNAVEEDHAVKEILQEIALYALWRADFFEVALFQGGTSLRILHQLPRFSEDLDFLLREPNADFDWAPYLKALEDVFREYGLKLEAQPKEKMDSAIKEALLKDDSLARQLNLAFAGRGTPKTIKIKLEVDVNPPNGSGEDTTYLDFPTDHLVRHQDIASNFALKLHALLCRGFLKGRDWYDFSWYVSKDVAPNLELLRNALVQAGPWRGDEGLAIDMAWLVARLTETIESIEWPAAAADVSRFLRPRELASVRLWSADFFKSRVAKMSAASKAA